MIRLGTFNEIELTIPIPSINIDFKNVHLVIAPWISRPYYENNIGNKYNVFAWKFTFGPISGCKLKNEAEIKKEWEA